MVSPTHPPAVSGRRRTFSALDPAAIAQWAGQELAASGESPAAIAVAGIALRGRHRPELPGVPPAAGSLIAGYSLYCQRNYRPHLLDTGGDCLAIAKLNQPKLYQAIALRRPLQRRPGRPVGRAGKRRPGNGWATRRLCTANARNGYLDWTGREWGQYFGLSDRCHRRAGKLRTRCATGLPAWIGEVGRPNCWAVCVGIGKLQTGCIRACVHITI